MPECAPPLSFPPPSPSPRCCLPPRPPDCWKEVVKEPFKRGIQNPAPLFSQQLHACLPPSSSASFPRRLRQVFPFQPPSPSAPISSCCPPPGPFRDSEVIHQIPDISPQSATPGTAAAGILPHQAAQETFRAVLPPSLPRVSKPLPDFKHFFSPSHKPLGKGKKKHQKTAKPQTNQQIPRGLRYSGNSSASEHRLAVLLKCYRSAEEIYVPISRIFPGFESARWCLCCRRC